MAVYRILIERSVLKQLKTVPKKDYNKIISAITSLADHPRPEGSIKLRGRQAYRIRQGNYRIIYEINDYALIVTVVDAGDRKDIYN